MNNHPAPDQSSSSGGELEQSSHVTVLLDRAIEGLALRPGGVYIDGTFGGGGHSRRLLETEPGIERLVAIDADLDAGPRAACLAGDLTDPGRFTFVHANFRELDGVAANLGLTHVDGFLLDLGVSSFQFDIGERGFSFRADAPLDMRFDQSVGSSAADLVASASAADLADIFWRYGDERQSRRIAAAIVREREKRLIETTHHLAQVVEGATGGRRGASIHPATRAFQALRIAVNDELDALEDVLTAANNVLAPGGRLVVISFHSLEDRIVKRFIVDQSRSCVCPPSQPVCTCDTVPRLKRLGRPIRPDDDEQRVNPRSRSAIMRVAERLDPDGQPAGRGKTR